ncbi:MAG TPA: hypothetical protein VF611_15815 [Pyrinomonadaceae bacterium]
MRKRLSTRVGALAFAWLLLLGGAAEVFAQRYRVRVYNPGRHARTRRAMSNRAAARAALKRKKQRQRRAARAHHMISRRTVN